MELGAMARFKRAELPTPIIEAMRKQLFFEQKSGKKYGFGPGQKLNLFKEVADWIDVPRQFGLTVARTRGIPVVDNTVAGAPISFNFTKTLRPDLDQPNLTTDFLSKIGQGASSHGAIFSAPCGCHAAGELILMEDGTTKKAEDIEVGDFLMGIDGARHVRELHRGRQRMAKVIPNKGEPFIVNVGHVLTLLWSVSDGARKDGEVIDVTVAEWLLSSKNFQRHTVLYRPRVDHFFNEYTEKDRPIQPYHLGLLLGDGTLTKSPGVTTEDPELVEECLFLADHFGLKIRKEDSNGTRCPTYLINSGEKFHGENPLVRALEFLGLLNARAGAKFIPQAYLTSSREDRLELLAGLIDSDGCVSCGGFDWISKSRRLAEGVVFLCRSLGLAAYLKPCWKKCQNGNGGMYYRVSISGNCVVVPVRVPRKRAPVRTINKDAQRVGFKIELLPENDYYGFVVDGDHRYLMGDFTWTHNTGKTIMTLYMLSKIGRPALILVHNGALVKQWRESMFGGKDTPAFTDLKQHEVGHIQQNVNDWYGRKVVVSMIESLISREYEPEMYKYFGVVVADEVHLHGAAEWHKAMNLFPARLRIGLSATPRRADGLWDVVRLNVGEVLTQGKAQRKAKVCIFNTGIEIPEENFRDKLTFLIGILAQHEFRNQLIAEEVVTALQAGRRALVLSHRREQLNVLQAMIAQRWGSAPGLQTGWYVGGVTNDQIDLAKTCNLLLGTYQYAKVGLDDPGMDTLFFATPSGDIEQPAGRILRSCIGKKEPLILDFVDDATKLCKGFGKARERQYDRLGFDVTVIEAPANPPETSLDKSGLHG